MIPDSQVEGASFLYSLDLVITLLSLGGSLLMLYLCLRMPSPRTLSVKFILAISLADLFYTIGNILSNFETESSHPLCSLEAILRQSSFILSIFFSTCTAIASYRASSPSKSFNQKKFFRQTVILGPLACILMSLFGHVIFSNIVIFSYGPVNCSIASSPTSSQFEMLLVEIIYRVIPISLGLVITIAGYTKAINLVKELPEEIIIQMNFNPYNLLWYPAVLILIFLPSVIDPLVSIFVPYRPPWLRALRMAIPHSIGFTNAVVYIILRKLYQNNELDIPEEEEDEKPRSRSVLFGLTTALRASEKDED